ncbi:hypothetical protein [Sphingopyxis kveilinensis]|uniref:hypothetical protein n=1 Tax=Sphingopyxis kveilinensis TaxID=3114367 RepID=UPI0030D28605
MHSPLLAPLGALLLLAGCSGEPAAESKAPETKTAAAESTLPDTGGDAPIELSAIGKGELLALDGELGCSFTVEGHDGAALVAKADVGPEATAQGAVKIGGRVQRVAGSGGFAALEKGMQLSGPGVKLTITRTAEASSPTGNEQTAYPATLVARRTFGGEQSFDGKWVCGA